MRKFITKLWQDESGISSVEYVLLLALVGSAIIAGASFLGQEVGLQLDETAQCIQDGTNCVVP
jgi:Flp pilus assembly pilin Flp